MAKLASKTTNKRPRKPFTGVEGKRFSKTNQPTPENKSIGWQERRKERLLTQEVLKQLVGDDGTGNNNLTSYINELIKLAKKGNPKAIETINKCIEDDVQKIEHTIKSNPLFNIDPLSDVQTNNSAKKNSRVKKAD